jgi:hypothetical protein
MTRNYLPAYIAENNAYRQRLVADWSFYFQAMYHHIITLPVRHRL